MNPQVRQEFAASKPSCLAGMLGGGPAYAPKELPPSPGFGETR